MINQQSILDQTALQSILGSAAVLNPKHKAMKKTLAADLLLTALIDAFSILVIFLLMNFSSSGEILFVDTKTELPKASVAATLDRNPVLKVSEREMFLDEKKVTKDTVVGELLSVRNQYASLHPGTEFPGIVTIQADRRIRYESLNQLVLAASEAGFSDIRFAVIMK